MAQPWVPQHHRDITLARLGTFTSESWGKSNILPVLYHARGGDISIEVWSPPAGLEHPKFEDVVKQQFRPAKCGESFGPTWATHWFRIHVRVPDDWVSAPAGAPLLFVWDSGSEAMVWLDDGQPQQGLTDERNEYVLSTSVRPGDAYVLYVEMSCNGVGGAGDGIQPPPTDRQYTLKVVELAVPDPLAQQLLADFLVVADIAKSLPADSAAGARALYTANAMINTFRREDRSTWEAARQLALKVLQRGASPAHQVTAIGHCHIDTAWLWPFEETHRKVARSWSAQLELLDRYPQHTFAASSAQQYAWLQAEYPGLWTRLKGAVAAGRFVPVGGTWVEMDTNVPSGESLVRQLLYGQRFFESAFGKRCDVFWLPDTFGYAAQLPQLVRGAGMDYFLTQKLSWNNINTFPHNTFMWEALDGTSLLTHFPPSNTYNSQVSVSDLLMSCTNHKDKDRSPSSLLLFGNGDGGGGPTQAMCEALERLADPQGLGVDGVVRCQQGNPNNFFKSVAAQAQDLLSWRGELYFELHRGTYTSHAANKMFNRRCEGLLREVEMLGALAVAHGASGYTYPRQELDELWQNTLLFQFHDVLPGSSIGLVYEHTAHAYPKMVATLQALRATAAAALLQMTQPAPPSPALPSFPLHAAVGQSGRQEPAGVGEDQRLAMGDVMGAQMAPGFLDSVEALGLSTAREQRGPIQPVDPRVGQPQRWAEPHVPVGGRWPSDGSCSGDLGAVHAPARDLWPAKDPWMGLVPSGGPRSEHATPNGPWVFNALSVSRTEVVAMPSHLVPPGVTAQVGAKNGPSPGAALVAVSLPPLSLAPVFGQEAACTAPLAEEEGVTACILRNANGKMVYQLMNRYVRVVLDSNGRLISMYDRLWHRELVPPGGLGNRFRIYEDVPIFWDAWDVEIYHLEKGADAGVPSSLEIVESGPVRACLAYSCPLSATSRLQQYITLTVSSPRLEFSSTIEWNETHKLLKVEFPWALQADQATYEVQFGAVARPTRPNTSWDWARFEVIGHRWADLSEPDYGVALLNDCKYGHATHGNTQRLTLLKSPKAPDANADMGAHTFRYALCPHAHGWQAGGVVAAGLAFNSPPILVPAPPGPAPQPATPAGLPRGAPGEPLLQVVPVGPRPVADHPGPLILDTLKLAETPVLVPVQPGAPTASTSPRKPEGVTLVARLYEPHGCRGRALLRVGGGLTLLRAAQGNLLEDVLKELPLVPRVVAPTHAGATAAWQGHERDRAAGHAGVGQGAGVVLEFTPFQVLTVLLWVQSPGQQ